MKRINPSKLNQSRLLESGDRWKQSHARPRTFISPSSLRYHYDHFLFFSSYFLLLLLLLLLLVLPHATAATSFRKRWGERTSDSDVREEVAPSALFPQPAPMWEVIGALLSTQLFSSWNISFHIIFFRGEGSYCWFVIVSFSSTRLEVKNVRKLSLRFCWPVPPWSGNATPIRN